MQDSIGGDRLLLGMSGWPHPEWEGGYFPEDLPDDWQFAFYSNDASCLLLRAREWEHLQGGLVEEWLEEVPGHFRFHLELPPGAAVESSLPPLGHHLGALLVDRFRDLASDIPQLCAGPQGYWVDPAGVPRLVRWNEPGFDLRRLRERLQGMPDSVRAVILEGEGLNPGHLSELRTLAELLGVA